MWVTITPDDIRARISKDEMEQYTEAGDQRRAGVDVLAGIIRQITAQVRGKVASCDDNLSKMGPSGTIPDECLFAACTLARHAFLAHLPTNEGASDDRKDEFKQANDFLDQIASCDVRIENGSGVIPEVPTSSSYASYGGCPLLYF